MRRQKSKRKNSKIRKSKKSLRSRKNMVKIDGSKKTGKKDVFK